MQDARIFFFRAHALPPAAHAHTPTHTTSIIKWYPSPPLDPVRTGRAEPQLQGHRSSGAGAAPAQWRHWWRAAGSLQAQLGLEMLRRGMCTCVHHQTSGCFEPYQHACQTAVSTDVFDTVLQYWWKTWVYWNARVQCWWITLVYWNARVGCPVWAVWIPAAGRPFSTAGTTGAVAISKRGWMMSIPNTPFFCHRFNTRRILLWIWLNKDINSINNHA